MLNIIQGERQPWSIDITSEATGKRYDLTGVSDVTVCFKTGSQLVTLKLSDVPTRVVIGADPKDGEISGYLSTTETAALTPTNTPGMIEVALDFGGGDVRKFQIESAFVVKAGICPA